MNILIIGSGGREHALTWKLRQSKQVDEIFILPGNAGTALVGRNVPGNISDFAAIRDTAVMLNIGLMVIGPEQPLVEGLHDFFATDEKVKHIPVIGPKKTGAQLEGSKAMAKKFMQRHNIPTAAYGAFTSDTLQQAENFLDSLQPPYVLKADGLAAGKGVIITADKDEAKTTVCDMFSGRFGSAGATVVIEEFLKGIELSVFVITDGKNYLLLPEAKDYKRIGENDSGPNTGGMGAVSPVPFADSAFMKKVEERIIRPTIDGLAQDGIEYTGFIFFGLINVQGNPYVIEYNARLGDPETEVVLPRITNDLAEILLSVHNGTLGRQTININPKPAVTVIVASGGYPGDYQRGFPIYFPDVTDDSILFHAGTAEKNGSVVTSGGRVLAVTSLGATLAEARENSYRLVSGVQFEQCYYRRDIGFDII